MMTILDGVGGGGETSKSLEEWFEFFRRV